MYTGERIDKFGEELDAQIEKRARTGPSAEEKAAARAQAMEVARGLLEEARSKLRAERKVPTGDSAALRAEAISRWGERAGDCETDDWEGYLASREASPAPTSPEPLLQEHYVRATALPALFVLPNRPYLTRLPGLTACAVRRALEAARGMCSDVKSLVPRDEDALH